MAIRDAATVTMRDIMQQRLDNSSFSFGGGGGLFADLADAVTLRQYGLTLLLLEADSPLMVAAATAATAASLEAAISRSVAQGLGVNAAWVRGHPPLGGLGFHQRAKIRQQQKTYSLRRTRRIASSRASARYSSALVVRLGCRCSGADVSMAHFLRRCVGEDIAFSGWTAVTSGLGEEAAPRVADRHHDATTPC